MVEKENDGGGIDGSSRLCEEVSFCENKYRGSTSVATTSLSFIVSLIITMSSDFLPSEIVKIFV